MLKITVEKKRDWSGRSVCLVLEGKLAGPGVQELEKTWNRFREESAASISVDLRAVTFISQNGAEMLHRLDTKGAELRPGSLLMSAWVAGMRHSAAHIIVLLAVCFAATSYGQQSLPVEQTPQPSAVGLTVDRSAPAVAFARYIASLQQRNLFTESGPIDVEIEASLPGFAKCASMLAVRQTGASERSEYSAIQINGDSTVKRQVIARYLAAEEQAEALPYSAVAVTPANYKFRYDGLIDNNGTAAYVFQIAPKKKRAGLLRGQIWIDSVTGVAVHQAGRFVKQPSIFIRRIEVTRETNLRDGLPYTRVTHIAIATRLVGRAELTITERPIPAESAVAQQLIAQRGVQ